MIYRDSAFFETLPADQRLAYELQFALESLWRAKAWLKDAEEQSAAIATKLNKAKAELAEAEVQYAAALKRLCAV